jgi:hypothetical protein
MCKVWLGKLEPFGLSSVPTLSYLRLLPFFMTWAMHPRSLRRAFILLMEHVS